MHYARAVHVQIFCTCSSFAVPTGQTVGTADAKLGGHMHTASTCVPLWLTLLWGASCARQRRKTVWPVGAARELQVQNICTCTARAQCTPAPFFIRHQVGNAKVHPRTEFGVASSEFTFTGGPLVKKIFRPWRVQPAPHRSGTPNGF